MKITNVNIYIPKESNSTSLVAFAGITIDDCFAIHNLKIIENEKGLFVAMPSAKYKDTFKDVCHPITKEARELIEEAVIEEYKKNIKQG